MKKFLIAALLTIGFVTLFDSRLLQIQNHHSVFAQTSRQSPALFVNHKINGRNLLVQCILTGISFRESDKPGHKTGKLVVSVDGRKVQEVTSAAFIMKNLPQGFHQIRLEVVDTKNVPYGLSKEFLVNIPK
nr:hypothetical protein [Neobacillus sp. Marseille-Q6967]